MGVNLNWIDLADSSVITLGLHSRVIYKAFVDHIEADIKLLRGRLITPLEPQVIRIKYWVIYESMEGEIRISPIYDRLFKEVFLNQSLFADGPVDIRLTLQMLDI